MKKIEFLKLIKKNKYQVFILASKVPLPFFFATHTWLVTSKKGKLERWEVGIFFHPRPKKAWGYVYLGLENNNPVTGMSVLPFSNKIKYKSRIVAYTEGNSKSKAKKIIDFLNKEAKNYPYRNKYRLLGPNSNTFTKWVLNHSNKTDLKLPWNAVGKNYQIKTK